MKICIICEGSYPYVMGGVSGWVQMLMKENPQIQFTIWSIATTPEEMHEYKYKIPENVESIQTFYLAERAFGGKLRRIRLSPREKRCLHSLLLDDGADIDWGMVLDFLKTRGNRLVDILMGEDFYYDAVELYNRDHARVVFSQFLWNLRSMYFPLVAVLSGEIPKVDLYHAVSTGYAGLLGAVASHISGAPFLLTEHGIYTREREEEIIRSDWVDGRFKQLWIDFFKKLSRIAYQKADQVITLFETNRQLEIELGCPPGKTGIIVNGVDTARFAGLPPRPKEADQYFTIGAVVRVVPIKDIKTMLLAFGEAKTRIRNARLLVLGPYDEDEDYYQECLLLCQELSLQDVAFTGRADVREYLMQFDIMLLTSISEGQPLAVLEGMAAGIPQVCTNVGSCGELLNGREGDPFGPAGLIVPVMDVDAIAGAVMSLAADPAERARMGEAGRNRAKTYYEKAAFLKAYKELYQEMGSAALRKQRV